MVKQSSSDETLEVDPKPGLEFLTITQWVLVQGQRLFLLLKLGSCEQKGGALRLGFGVYFKIVHVPSKIRAKQQQQPAHSSKP